MRLEPGDVTSLLGAMDTSFDPFSLQRVVQDRLGVNLFLITSPYYPLPNQTLDLHSTFHHRNETEKLVAALHDARPRVAEFVRLSDQFGISTVPARQRLEVLTQTGRSPYEDVITFRSELAAREAAVCRVETEDG